jgi:hypothetical protein
MKNRAFYFEIIGKNEVQNKHEYNANLCIQFMLTIYLFINDRQTQLLLYLP